MRNKKILTSFLVWSARTAGKPTTFIIALLVLFSWIIIGFFIGFTDTWLLVIDTIATINASLMVFIIQNTQIRESKALHLKVDGLIAAAKDAENKLIAIEELEEDEIEKMRKQIQKKRKETE